MAFACCFDSISGFAISFRPDDRGAIRGAKQSGSFPPTRPRGHTNSEEIGSGMSPISFVACATPSSTSEVPDL
jgi:hypothetical protein